MKASAFARLLAETIDGMSDFDDGTGDADTSVLHADYIEEERPGHHVIGVELADGSTFFVGVEES